MPIFIQLFFSTPFFQKQSLALPEVLVYSSLQAVRVKSGPAMKKHTHNKERLKDTEM